MHVLRQLVIPQASSDNVTCSGTPMLQCARHSVTGIIRTIQIVLTLPKLTRGHPQDATLRHCAGPRQAYPEYQTRIGHP